MLSVCYFVFIFPWKYPSFYLLSVFIESCYPNTLYCIFCDFCIRHGAIIHRWPLLSKTWPRHNVMLNTEAIQGPDTGEDVTTFKHNSMRILNTELVQVSRWNIYLEPSCSKVNIWLSHSILSLKHSINSCAGDDVNVTFLTSGISLFVQFSIHCLQWRYSYFSSSQVATKISEPYQY